MLTGWYEAHYRIRDHKTQDLDNPIPYCAIGPIDEPTFGAGLRERMNEFMSLGIGTKLNISFFDFIKRPRHEVKVIIDICRQETLQEQSRTAEQNTDSDRLLRELNQVVRKTVK